MQALNTSSASRIDHSPQRKACGREALVKHGALEAKRIAALQQKMRDENAHLLPSLLFGDFPSPTGFRQRLFDDGDNGNNGSGSYRCVDDCDDGNADVADTDNDNPKRMEDSVFGLGSTRRSRSEGRSTTRDAHDITNTNGHTGTDTNNNNSLQAAELLMTRLREEALINAMLENEESLPPPHPVVGGAHAIAGLGGRSREGEGTESNAIVQKEKKWVGGGGEGAGGAGGERERKGKMQTQATAEVLHRTSPTVIVVATSPAEAAGSSETLTPPPLSPFSAITASPVTMADVCSSAATGKHIGGCCGVGAQATMRQGDATAVSLAVPSPLVGGGGPKGGRGLGLGRSINSCSTNIKLWGRPVTLAPSPSRRPSLVAAVSGAAADANAKEDGCDGASIVDRPSLSPPRPPSPEEASPSPPLQHQQRRRNYHQHHQLRALTTNRRDAFKLWGGYSDALKTAIDVVLAGKASALTVAATTNGTNKDGSSGGDITFSNALTSPNTTTNNKGNDKARAAGGAADFAAVGSGDELASPPPPPLPMIRLGSITAESPEGAAVVGAVASRVPHPPPPPLRSGAATAGAATRSPAAFVAPTPMIPPKEANQLLVRRKRLECLEAFRRLCAADDAAMSRRMGMLEAKRASLQLAVERLRTARELAEETRRVALLYDREEYNIGSVFKKKASSSSVVTAAPIPNYSSSFSVSLTTAPAPRHLSVAAAASISAPSSPHRGVGVGAVAGGSFAPPPPHRPSSSSSPLMAYSPTVPSPRGFAGDFACAVPPSTVTTTPLTAGVPAEADCCQPPQPLSEKFMKLSRNDPFWFKFEEWVFCNDASETQLDLIEKYGTSTGAKYALVPSRKKRVAGGDASAGKEEEEDTKRDDDAAAANHDDEDGDLHYVLNEADEQSFLDNLAALNPSHFLPPLHALVSGGGGGGGAGGGTPDKQQRRRSSHTDGQSETVNGASSPSAPKSDGRLFPSISIRGGGGGVSAASPPPANLFPSPPRIASISISPSAAAGGAVGDGGKKKGEGKGDSSSSPLVVVSTARPFPIPTPPSIAMTPRGDRSVSFALASPQQHGSGNVNKNSSFSPSAQSPPKRQSSNASPPSSSPSPQNKAAGSLILNSGLVEKRPSVSNTDATSGTTNTIAKKRQEEGGAVAGGNDPLANINNPIAAASKMLMNARAASSLSFFRDLMAAMPFATRLKRFHLQGLAMEPTWSTEGFMAALVYEGLFRIGEKSLLMERKREKANKLKRRSRKAKQKRQRRAAEKQQAAFFPPSSVREDGLNETAANVHASPTVSKQKTSSSASFLNRTDDYHGHHRGLAHTSSSSSSPFQHLEGSSSSPVLSSPSSSTSFLLLPNGSGGGGGGVASSRPSSFLKQKALVSKPRHSGLTSLVLPFCSIGPNSLFQLLEGITNSTGTFAYEGGDDESDDDDEDDGDAIDDWEDDEALGPLMKKEKEKGRNPLPRRRRRHRQLVMIRPPLWQSLTVLDLSYNSLDATALTVLTTFLYNPAQAYEVGILRLKSLNLRNNNFRKDPAEVAKCIRMLMSAPFGGSSVGVHTATTTAAAATTTAPVIHALLGDVNNNDGGGDSNLPTRAIIQQQHTQGDTQDTVIVGTPLLSPTSFEATAGGPPQAHTQEEQQLQSTSSPPRTITPLPTFTRTRDGGVVVVPKSPVLSSPSPPSHHCFPLLRGGSKHQRISSTVSISASPSLVLDQAAGEEGMGPISSGAMSPATAGSACSLLGGGEHQNVAIAMPYLTQTTKSSTLQPRVAADFEAANASALKRTQSSAISMMTTPLRDTLASLDISFCGFAPEAKAIILREVAHCSLEHISLEGLQLTAGEALTLHRQAESNSTLTSISVAFNEACGGEKYKQKLEAVMRRNREQKRQEDEDRQRLREALLLGPALANNGGDGSGGERECSSPSPSSSASAVRAKPQSSTVAALLQSRFAKAFNLAALPAGYKPYSSNTSTAAKGHLPQNS